MIRRSTRRPWLAIGALALAAALGTGCGGASEAATDPGPPATTPGTMLGPTRCPAPDGSSERTVQFAQPPPLCIDPARRYDVVMETDAGELRATLDPRSAPNAVNNFVVLARYHFYDGTPLDRVYLGEAIGGGAQPPPGRQDAGYRFADELPADPATAYVSGTLMLDTQGRDTNGSRFLVLASDAGVAPKFTVLGTVTAGMDTVVPAVMATADATGAVATPLLVRRVTVTER